MPALIVSQVISSGFGFSRKRLDVAVGVGLDEAVGGRVLDRRQHDRRLGLPLAVEPDARRRDRPCVSTSPLKTTTDSCSDSPA